MKKKKESGARCQKKEEITRALSLPGAIPAMTNAPSAQHNPCVGTIIHPDVSLLSPFSRFVSGGSASIDAWGTPSRRNPTLVLLQTTHRTAVTPSSLDVRYRMHRNCVIERDILIGNARMWADCIPGASKDFVPIQIPL